MPLKIKSGQKLVFMGDSITDCGRRDIYAPLGNGYPSVFAALLAVREPQKDIIIVNKGIGGDTVINLQNRWEDDIIREKPDWLSIKIGINDLHRTLDKTPAAVPVDKFEEVYDELLARTKKKLPKCNVLLISPFFLSNDRSPNSRRNTVLEMLPPYLDVVYKMAKKYKTRLLKTHDMFQNMIKYYPADRFSPEAVHPSFNGHIAIADAVYDKLSK